MGSTHPSIFQQLYSGEINFEVTGFFDCGFTVKIGDALGGYLAKAQVDTWAEVEAWLRQQLADWDKIASLPRKAPADTRRKALVEDFGISPEVVHRLYGDEL